MPKQSCNWCFTINNPSKVKTCGEKDKFKDLTFDTDEKVINFIMQYEEVNYYVFQRERGHNENTEHIQGFIQFKNRKRGTTLQNMFPPQFFHGEFANGTAQQASDYCKKSDTRIGEVQEWGELRVTKGGKQLTNEDILQRIKEGADDIRLLEEFPQLWNQIDRLQKVRDLYVFDKWRNVFRDVQVTYICGQSGTGKTRSVMEHTAMIKFIVSPTTNTLLTVTTGRMLLCLRSLETAFLLIICLTTLTVTLLNFLQDI